MEQGHRLFQTGKRGCHGPGVIDKAVLLSIRTAIPKMGSPWHPSLKAAMALRDGGALHGLLIADPRHIQSRVSSIVKFSKRALMKFLQVAAGFCNFFHREVRLARIRTKSADRLNRGSLPNRYSLASGSCPD